MCWGEEDRITKAIKAAADVFLLYHLNLILMMASKLGTELRHRQLKSDTRIEWTVVLTVLVPQNFLLKYMKYKPTSAGDGCLVKISSGHFREEPNLYNSPVDSNSVRHPEMEPDSFLLHFSYRIC